LRFEILDYGIGQEDKYVYLNFNIVNKISIPTSKNSCRVRRPCLILKKNRLSPSDAPYKQG